MSEAPVATSVDTSVLLDLLIGRSPEFEKSKSALQAASESGPLVCCDVVYAEVAAHLRSETDAAAFFKDFGLRRVPFSDQALLAAGRAWKTYAQRKPRRLQCPRCGSGVEASCPNCGFTITPRYHILSDFLIGAHALDLGCRLLTRDRGYYREYFPGLLVVEP